MKVQGLRLVMEIVMLAGLISIPALGDSIALRDGRVVQGKFAGGTQGVIAFSVNGATQYYDVRNILVMIFEGDESDAQGIHPGKSLPNTPGEGQLSPQYQGARRKPEKPAVKLVRGDAHD